MCIPVRSQLLNRTESLYGPSFLSSLCDELESLTRSFQEIKAVPTVQTQSHAKKKLDYASLHAAVKDADADFELVQEMVQHQDITLAANGFTALHAAAAFGHVDMVSMLLDRGLNQNHRTTAGTPLSCAVTSGHRSVISALLLSQANPNGCLFNGVTPLHLAAKKGDVWITQTLLEAGANPLFADEKGMTALDVAAAHDAPHDVRKLLSDKEAELKTIDVDHMLENMDTDIDGDLNPFTNSFQIPLNF